MKSMLFQICSFKVHVPLFESLKKVHENVFHGTFSAKKCIKIQSRNSHKGYLIMSELGSA